MNGAVSGIVLLAVALWILAPDPHHGLRRLTPVRPAPAGKLVRLVRGREGAPSLNARALVGSVAALLLFTLLPTGWGVLALLGAPLLAVVGGGRLTLTRRTGSALQDELADTVELLAVCLSSGAPTRHALEVVSSVQGAATSTVLGKVSGLLAVGVTEQQAWQELVQHDVWGPVARDVARSARSGTSLVEVLHVHAEEARRVAQEKALQRARTAGVRSVIPLMACFLPAFVLVGVLPLIAGLLGKLFSP